MSLRKNRVRGHVARRRKEREPAVTETHKTAVFMYGRQTSMRLKEAMRDVAQLKKPHVLQLTRKNDVVPMEDPTELERVLHGADAGLFVFGSNSKKRPDNLVLGRTFDDHVLDMVELGVTFFESMQAVQRRCKSGTAATETAPPMLVFRGEAFANALEGGEMATLKSMLLDLFRGRLATEMDLEALDLVVVFTAVQQPSGKTVVAMRTYRTDFSKPEAGSALPGPAVSLVEHGPHLDLELRRSRVAAPNLAKLARKQLKLTANSKKRKNVTHDKFQGKMGRLHVPKQSVEQVVQRSRFRKALKRGGGGGGGGKGGGAPAHKRARKQ